MSDAGFDMPRFYSAFGDITRLRLLNLMAGQELCVCYFVEVLGQSQPKISRHLALLRRTGIVAARRQGTWMHYRIVTPEHAGASIIFRETLAWMRNDPAMQADRARLSRVCCALADYEALEGAPLPTPIETLVAG